jgi:hypothetical protein
VERKQRRGKPISASELGRFLYCERAWWYGAQGEESSHLEALERGTQRHEAFAGEVRLAERVRAGLRVLIWLVLAAIVLVAIGLATGIL